MCSGEVFLARCPLRPPMLRENPTEQNISLFHSSHTIYDMRDMNNKKAMRLHVQIVFKDIIRSEIKEEEEEERSDMHLTS